MMNFRADSFLQKKMNNTIFFTSGSKSKWSLHSTQLIADAWVVHGHQISYKCCHYTQTKIPSIWKLPALFIGYKLIFWMPLLFVLTFLIADFTIILKFVAWKHKNIPMYTNYFCILKIICTSDLIILKIWVFNHND